MLILTRIRCEWLLGPLKHGDRPLGNAISLLKRGGSGAWCRDESPDIQARLVVFGRLYPMGPCTGHPVKNRFNEPCCIVSSMVSSANSLPFKGSSALRKAEQFSIKGLEAVLPVSAAENDNGGNGKLRSLSERCLRPTLSSAILVSIV